MVYVGRREYSFMGMKMSHMAADTLDELHAMADKIGIDRDHFQDKPGRPHYDISKGRKRMAKLYGAKEVDDREIVTLFKNGACGNVDKNVDK